MAGSNDALEAARQAFQQTIDLKLQQFYRVVPKGSNSTLTGKFIEELVRGFIQDWIRPCLLLNGTLHPHDLNPELPSAEAKPQEIDGIVYDPRLGPPIIREGGFLVVHPRFCRGVIEIKASEENISELKARLQSYERQYLFCNAGSGARVSERVMGVIVHHSNPKKQSFPKWSSRNAIYGHPSHPIFILFKKKGDEYEPHEEAIDTLIRTIFSAGWQYGSREDALGYTPFTHEPPT